jgi:hypothetical protein
MEITLKFGLTKQVTREVAEGTTLRQILADPSNKAVLGYPENVSGLVDGVTLGLDNVLSDGDVIVLEKQAASKAA